MAKAIPLFLSERKVSYKVRPILMFKIWKKFWEFQINLKLILSLNYKKFVELRLNGKDHIFV
jgi:hypothetical protein